MAEATGGITESTSNVKVAFDRAISALVNGYLIYYSPKTPMAEGGFKAIEIRIKGRELRVLHRAGYIAD